MTNENRNAVEKIVDETMYSFAGAIKKRFLEEADNPNGVINLKKNNCFIAELGEEFMFYSAFVRSFDSSFGNLLENMGNSIARRFYDVRGEISSYLLPEQTQLMATLMSRYDEHVRPETVHYSTFSPVPPRDVSSFRCVHQTDNYFYDEKDKIHYIIELKAGGDLDNKKAKAEKQEMIKEYFLLKNKIPADEKVEIHFATAYNKYGEGSVWRQSRVEQYFAPEELMIGKAYWNFVCADPDGFDIIFGQYKTSAEHIKSSLDEIKARYFEKETAYD